jgi:hypothetical protein
MSDNNLWEVILSHGLVYRLATKHCKAVQIMALQESCREEQQNAVKCGEMAFKSMKINGLRNLGTIQPAGLH